MTFFLKDYTLGNKMVVVARSKETLDDLLTRNIETMYVQDTLVLFYPESTAYYASDDCLPKLGLLCDYDIVEISDTGVVYRAYANDEADTTVFMGAKCNSNCIMCPASDNERRNGFSYSPELLRKYLNYLPENQEYLILTGGEPTLQAELFLEVLERIRTKFPYTQVLLLTNGRSLSNKWFFDRVCEHQPENFRIAVPLHADNAELHDYITSTPGSFDQTVLALRRLMDSSIKVEIRIVVTQVNCDHLLEIAKFIVRNFHRVFCVNFLGLEPRGNCALNFDTVYIGHRESFEKSRAAIEYLISAGYDVGLYNYPLCAVDRDFWPIAAKSISGYKNIFRPECNECCVRSICAGFFSAAIRIANPVVKPYLRTGNQ